MLHKRSIKEKLLKGSAWAFSGKVIIAFSGLFINVLLTRLLTPEEMGTYFLVFSLVSVAAIVAQFGLTKTIVRLVAGSLGEDKPGRAKQSVILVLRIVAFSVITIGSLLIFGIGEWIAIKLFDSVIMSEVIGIAAVWVVFFTFQQLLAEIYRGYHDVRLATIFGGLITSLFSMIAFFILWFYQGKSDIEQIILLTIGAGASSVLISSAILWNKLKDILVTKREVYLSEVIGISWPLWITGITLFILTQSDLWLLGIFRSQEEVAIYGLASRMIAMVAMPFLIVNAVVPPLISELFVQKRLAELEETLRIVATLAGLPSLLVLLLFIFYGEFILGFLFGAFYQTGNIVLIILGIGQLANIFAGSCGLTLMLTGHQFIMMMITIVAGLLTIFFAWWLVVDYGSIGVASAAAGGMVLQNILMLLLTRHKLGIWTHIDPFLIFKLRRLNESAK